MKFLSWIRQKEALSDSSLVSAGTVASKRSRLQNQVEFASNEMVCAQEYFALLREFGNVQQRVAKVIDEKTKQIAELESELQRMRANK